MPLAPFLMCATKQASSLYMIHISSQMLVLFFTHGVCHFRMSLLKVIDQT